MADSRGAIILHGLLFYKEAFMDKRKTLGDILTRTKALRDKTEKQLANAREQLKKPFAKDKELKQKEARLRELNALLNVDKREKEMIDEEYECDETTHIKTSRIRDEVRKCFNNK